MGNLVREYQEQDQSDVMAVWEAASAIAHPFLPQDFVSQVREDIPKLYLPNAETWVVEHQGRVIGFIALLGNEVGAIFVSPDQQGNGYGQLLMNKAFDLKGQLDVEVFKKNSIGCDFYKKYGFVILEEKVHEQTGLDLLRLQTPVRSE